MTRPSPTATQDLTETLQPAREALGAGDLSTARKLIEGCLAISREDPMALFELGLVQQAEKDLQGAMDTWSQVLDLDPNSLETMRAMAGLLAAEGQKREACEFYEALLSHDPDDAEGHLALGVTLSERGHMGRAFHHLEAAVELLPDEPLAFCLLGLAEIEVGRLPAAHEHLNRALELDPEQERASIGLGRLCVTQLRYPEAALHLRKGVEQRPDDAALAIELSKVLLECGETDAALTMAERAYSLAPHLGASITTLALILEIRGDFSAAERHYRDLLQLAPTYAPPYYRLARMGCLESVDEIDTVLNSTSMSLQEQGELHFAAGEVLRRNGNYDAAFERYRLANKAKSSTQCFNPESQTAFAKNTIWGTSAKFFAPDSACERGSNLLFILGMPRTGSTLVEQILSCHSAVHASGENSMIGSLMLELWHSGGRTGSLIQTIEELTAEQLEQLAARYMKTCERAPAGSLITDKSPGNYAHLALIARLFPQARVIHTQRHPIDTALSCYFTNFSSTAGFFACDLEHIAQVSENYRMLMKHFESVLPLDMHEVHYEELVGDLEGESRKLIEFCGLEWEPACLEFDTHERDIRTASIHQVRVPIHSRSVGMWRNYRAHLGPLERLVDASELEG